MQLEGILKSLEQDNNATSIAIPEFMGISSTSIKKLLKDHGFDLSYVWQQCTQKHFHETARATIFTTKKLPEPALKELKNIATTIKKVCHQITEHDHAHETLEHLHEFIKKAHDNTWSLMVRSTGAEDSETLANAGGNVSICNVPPTIEKIMYAVGEVLGSYLSEKSLQQRLSSGDTSIFDEPFTPVLLQRMVGETFHKNNDVRHIPVGCVVYSHEHEGHAQDTVVVQASYGHNAGVVDNLVTTDTFYIHPHQIFSIIKPKTQRLVPKNLSKHGGGLTFQKNKPEFASTPCLPEKVLRTLAHLAHVIEAAYHTPMDLEVVYMPENDTLYLVQARPLVVPKRTHQPSYLDLNGMDTIEKIPCTTISSHNYTIEQISFKQQVILSTTLEQALMTYLQSSHKKIIKTVIVEQTPNTTSHAAATFRGEGISIIQSNHLRMLAEWLEKPLHILTIDPQQHLMVLTTNQTEPFKAVTGWRHYPLPLHLSIPEDCILMAASGHDHYPATSIAQLLETLSSSDHQHAEKALESVLERIKKSCRQIRSFPEPLRSFLHTTAQKLDHLYAYAHQVAKRLKPFLTQALHHQTRLFFTRFFECIVRQEPSSEISRSFSYRSLMQDFNEKKQFFTHVIKPLLKKGAISRDFLLKQETIALINRAQNTALTNSVIQNWIVFIYDSFISSTRFQQKQFHAMLHDIDDLGFFSAWLNTAFYHHTIQQKLSANQSCAKLYRHYHQAKNILATFKKKKELLHALAQEQWDNPEKTHHALTSLKKNILNYCSSGAIKRHIKKTSRSNNILLQLAISNFLHEMIATFDTIIKTMKATTHGEPSHKITLIKTALTLYAQLLKLCDIPQAVIQRLMTVIKKQKESPKALFPSPNFDVKNLVNGLITDDADDENLESELENMSSLEDAFTSIHQLLLYQLGAWIVAWNLHNALALPHMVKNLESSLDLQENLTSITFENNGILLGYHHKLRAHSLEITLHYSPADASCQLTGRFYGYNEYARWQIISDYLKALPQSRYVTLTECSHSSSHLTFSLNVKNYKATKQIKKALTNAVLTSYKLGIEYEESIYHQTTMILKKLYHDIRHSKISISTFSMLMLPHFGSLKSKSSEQHRAAKALALQALKWINNDDDYEIVYAFHVFELLTYHASHLIGPINQTSAKQLYHAYARGRRWPINMIKNAFKKISQKIKVV